MAQRYFELIEDMSSPDRWLLGDPLDARGKEVPTRPFTSGERVHTNERLRVPIYHPGTPLDFTRVDPGAVPVVTEKVARVLAELAPDDVQLLPVEVSTRTERYFLVNVVRFVKCIDDEASEEVLYWKLEDGRPEKVGQYRDVYGMRIDPSRVVNARVFRPWGWKMALIVAEEVKDALEQSGATGFDFSEVTALSSPEDR